MKIRLFLLLGVLFCLCLPGCTSVRYMKDISEVQYTRQSGTVSPELYERVEITIATDKVTLTRRGATADTEINEGVWEFAADVQQVAVLFEQLAAVDCAAIKRVDPDEPTDGGGSTTYTVIYGNDKTFSVWYGGETTFTNGGLITEPVDAFIKRLTLTSDAAYQYMPLPD